MKRQQHRIEEACEKQSLSHEMELSNSHGWRSMQRGKVVVCRKSIRNRGASWIRPSRQLFLVLHLLILWGCFSTAFSDAVTSRRDISTLRGYHEDDRNLQGVAGVRWNSEIERGSNLKLDEEFHGRSWSQEPFVKRGKLKQVASNNRDRRYGIPQRETDSDCDRHIRGSNCGAFQRKLNAESQGNGRVLLESKRRSLADNATEAEVLLNWRASLIEGPRPVFATWNLSSQPNFCLWRGIFCVDDSPEGQHVSIINLSGSRISGALSSGLSALSHLTTLDMSYNRLTGGIPDDLIEMSSLQILDLSYNRISGNVPRFGDGQNSSRLEKLNLSKNKLSGYIPTSLGQCKQLRELNLAMNDLEGTIPSELGGLSNLQQLNLLRNRLSGMLPPALGDCRSLSNFSAGSNALTGPIPEDYETLGSLRSLYLDDNSLSGELPAWISSLSGLSELSLHLNNFSGQIPSFSGNQNLTFVNLSNNTLSGAVPTALVGSTTLVHLFLSSNQLSQGIPDAFPQGSSLQRLYVDHNRLTGSIPTTLANCNQLTEVGLSGNQINGSIFANIGGLAQLRILELNGNYLRGTIPNSLSSCRNLTVLNLSNNQFTSAIPGGISQLTNLTTLDLSLNSLAGVLPSMGGLTPLQTLALDHNLLSGPIPAALGNLKQLQILSLGDNNFGGTIPSRLSECVSMRMLRLENNNLSGSIPGELGQLPSLSVLHLQGNRLSGPIPYSGFYNSTQMSDFVVSDNQLTGQIDASLLSIFSQLQGDFALANNQLTGPLPAELGLLSSVRSMNLSRNGFSEGIPAEIGNCTALMQLDLSSNNLTGGLPDSVGSLSSLQLLNASQNELSGPIPTQAIGGLRNLRVLDLSSNNFSGGVPTSLSGLSSLAFLNLSDNNLQGPVPTNGTLGKFNASSFLGNPDLCGVILGVDCPGLGSSSNSSSSGGVPIWAWILIALGAGVVLLIALIILMRVLRMFSKRSVGVRRKAGSIIQRSELFYPQLRFTVQDLKQATESFSESNILGRGSLSEVYRGVLPELVLVAVKKLRTAEGTEIPPQFLEELNELGKLRHKHLVAILGYCFDPEMHALVVQFMSNGSLEQQLHGGPRCELEWGIRAKVGIGVAKALAFLHYGCGSMIVHSDLKPSNVLLDAEFEPHLEDFSLSRLIFANRLMEMTHSSVGNSLGYFPPEYSHSPVVSPQGDVYSYGILLLELLTGKKPNASIFKDDMTLTSWCQAAYPERVAEVLDPFLNESNKTNRKQVALFMKYALMCVKENPDERPTISVVLEALR